MINVHFDNIRVNILEELNKATERIIVAVYWFTNYALFQKLIDKVLQGIKVELIIHNDYINNREAGLNFQHFIDIGGEFYFSSNLTPMHNKFCVVDNRVLINGSYNWTYFAEDKNKENILIINNEEEVIKSFISEFELLKIAAEKIEKIEKLTKDDIDEFGNKDYLAYDIVYKVKTEGNKENLDNAFQIAPENIDVQLMAVDLRLTKQYRLKNSIGAGLKNDRYLVIVPKDSYIPISSSEIVQTIENNQTSITATIYFGDNLKASSNSRLGKFTFLELPPKPAGELKFRYSFTIDIYGILRMEKLSVDTGVCKVSKVNIAHLLEEISG